MRIWIRIGFEVENASPYATHHLVLGKRDAGSDAPAKAHLMGVMET